MKQKKQKVYIISDQVKTKRVQVVKSGDDTAFNDMALKLKSRPEMEAALKSATEIQNEVIAQTERFELQKKAKQELLEKVKHELELLVQDHEAELKLLVQNHEAKLATIRKRPEFRHQTQMMEMAKELEVLENMEKTLNALGYRKIKEEEQ